MRDMLDLALIALLLWLGGCCAGAWFMRRDIEREDE